MSDLENLLDQEFKFKIGDVVTNASFPIAEKPMQRFSVPIPRMIVVERFLQQCHGGVQKLYRVHQYGISHHENMQLTPETAFRRIHENDCAILD